ncbi:MAG: phosphatidate cytidylyltransferase [Chlorobi bacterium]|nr:phosphatidate cytidylyltransferase [Chlorobiota bacterium]MCI0716861.1 phosphatidate cytidylyltransferase [Chlorobiota bacterium]
MNNTAVRVIVGVVGIPLVIALAVLGNYYFLVFCAVISFFCMNEFYNLFESPQNTFSGFLKWFGGFSFHKAIFLLINSLIVINFYFEHVNYVLILYFLMFVYLIIDEVFKAAKHFEAIGTWLLSIVYISTPFGLLSLMGSDKFINLFEANYAIICMILVWASDTFAFFGGKLFGRHKLAERISPKKTWEGSIIGFVFTLFGGLLIHQFFYSDFALTEFLIIALIVGVFAQIGDLFESHLKRSVEVKDSSNIIPGHGGVLDRFDSLLFSVPALYIYLYLKSTL